MGSSNPNPRVDIRGRASVPNVKQSSIEADAAKLSDQSHTNSFGRTTGN